MINSSNIIQPYCNVAIQWFIILLMWFSMIRVHCLGHTPFWGKPARLPVQRREPQQAQGSFAKWSDNQSCPWLQWKHWVFSPVWSFQECFLYDILRLDSFVGSFDQFRTLLIILCNGSVETFQECDSRSSQLLSHSSVWQMAGGPIRWQNIEVTAVCFWLWKSHHSLIASCKTASLPYHTIFDQF